MVPICVDFLPPILTSFDLIVGETSSFDLQLRNNSKSTINFSFLDSQTKLKRLEMRKQRLKEEKRNRREWKRKREEEKADEERKRREEEEARREAEMRSDEMMVGEEEEEEEEIEERRMPTPGWY